MNIEEIITQANIYWKIHNLRADLEFAKETEKNRNKPQKLTDNEYHSLCGLLCNYKPATIAKILSKEAASIRVELATGLYRYIEILIQDKTNQEFIIKWSDIPIQLEKLGYKKSPSIPPTSAEKVVGWRMWIDIEDIDQIQLDAIVKTLKQLTGNSSLKLDKIDKGSILLFFESTQAGYERIQALFRDDQLTELLNVPVLDVRLTSEIPAVNPNPIVNLNQWLQDNFVEAIAFGWQVIENILPPKQLAFMDANVTKRGRLINIGDSYTVAVVIQLTRKPEELVDVTILVYPVEEDSNYLPENLKLTVTFAEETEEIQTGGETNFLRQEITELLTGEQFNVQLSLDNDSVSLDFSI